MEELLPHALRVKGLATADALADALGVDDVAGSLDALEAAGEVTRRGAGGVDYFALTEAGREREAAATAGRLDAAASGRLADVYDRRFLPLNATFKGLCADWQENGERFELVEQAVEVHEQLEAILAEAASQASWLGRYSGRLDRAMGAFEDGDGAALVGPDERSYHHIWFELHEDLLVTLGRERGAEDA